MAVGVVLEADLGQRNEIGSGAMARVYSIPDFHLPATPSIRYAYKRFRSRSRPVPSYGLEALVRLNEGLAPRQREAFDRSFNWPVRVVVDGKDGAAGVILPLLPDTYFVKLRLSSGTSVRKPAEAQFLFKDSAYCARVGIAFPDEEQRRQLCRSLTYALGLLDRADIVYGDLSSRNLLFRLSPKPSVMLVDCDAVRSQGGAAACGHQPHSPDWEPPEAIDARRRKDSTGYSIQSKTTDRYKLGLAILRILTPGDGCSTNIDPRPVRAHIPGSLYTMLERSLGKDPHARPSAKDWHRELMQ